MNPSSSSSSSNPQSMAASTSGATSEGGGSYGKKVRKPYTITKSRESWTDEEHDKFLEALQLFDRDWKKIEDYVGSKTVIQIRSHAQKYFLKVQKNGTTAHVPPPRPKRKATHPYPHKATKNEADMGSEGIAGIINGRFSSNENSLPSLDMLNQGSLVHGTPDFAEVYNFIGSVFDPNTNGHLEKMKEMDPINYETVLLLMRNFTANLSSHNFEPIRHVLSSFDDQYTEVGGTGDITVKQNGDCLPAERPTTYSWACLDASSSFSHLVPFNDEQACKEWNFKLRMQY